MTNVKDKKKNNKKFYKILSFILLFCSVFMVSVLIYFDVLPLKYLIVGGIVFGLIIVLLMYKLNVKTNLFTKLLCSLFSIIFIGLEILVSIYAFGTIEFFNNIFDTGYRLESYGIYVLNESDYKSIKDLNDKKIGFYVKDDVYIDKVLKKLDRKIDYAKDDYDSISSLIKSLKDDKNNALVINETLMDVYLEEHDIDELKLLDTIDITVKSSSDFKNVNVTKMPFVIYLSGVDTKGTIKKSSRSDVNILVFVNPQTGKILILNTPRDYYLTLYSKNAKDKLTHAGIYGIEESAKSLGLLYEADINYYARVNFTSFVKIIDTLGGIEVDVEKPDFRYNQGIDCGTGYVCEQNSNRSFGSSMIYIKSGKRTLSGEEALAYARNRYQYAGGDNDRQRHQQQILKAVFEKLTSSSTLTKYKELLKDLSSGVLTNIDANTITKLVNYQLSENINWEVNTYTVKGIDGYEPTYSTGKSKVYVQIPDDESVYEAKTKISEVME